MKPFQRLFYVSIIDIKAKGWTTIPAWIFSDFNV